MSEQSVIPMLAVHDAESALHFYKEVFQAEELTRMVTDEGKIEHAEIAVGDARMMVADEFPGHNHAAKSLGGTPVILYLYVPDVDEVVKKATQAGGISLRPIQNLPHGDRVGKFEDPFGHIWMIASRITAK